MKTLSQHRQDIFLQNLDAQIDAHLSDSTLHVGHLQRFARISRTNLHCKLKQAAGVSATEYLRRRRLQKAAELLHDHPNWCVWAVAVEVGFENLGYFTRRFKERYGCSPGVWRKRVLEERAEFRTSVQSQEHTCKLSLKRLANIVNNILSQMSYKSGTS